MPTKHQPPMDRTHEDEHTSNPLPLCHLCVPTPPPSPPISPFVLKMRVEKNGRGKPLGVDRFYIIFHFVLLLYTTFQKLSSSSIFFPLWLLCEGYCFATVTCKTVCYSKTNRFGDHYSGISWSENNLWIG